MMKSKHLFVGEEPVYKVINHAMLNSKSQGFYNAIFTDDYEQLEVEDKSLVIGVILGEYGLDFKELVDECISEKINYKGKLKYHVDQNGVVHNIKIK